MSSSEDERGLGTDLKAISSGERTLALSFFNHGTEKVKYYFFLTGNDVFVVTSPTSLEVKQGTHYEVTLKKATKLDGVYPSISSEDLIIVLTWGKRKHSEEFLLNKKEEARTYALKKLGAEDKVCFDVALTAAKYCKSMNISSSWAYILYNSKFNANFGNGMIALYGGERVHIIHHKTSGFDVVEEGSFVTMNKFLVDGKDGIITTTDSKMEKEGLMRKNVLAELVKLDHKKSNSACVIGHVASVENNEYNQKSGRRYSTGWYITLKIEDKVSNEMKTFRVWSENNRIENPNDMLGRLILIPTSHRSTQDDPGVLAGFSIINMKEIKRKSLVAAETQTSAKCQKK